MCGSLSSNWELSKGSPSCLSLTPGALGYQDCKFPRAGGALPALVFSDFFVWGSSSSPLSQLRSKGFHNSSLRIAGLSRFFLQPSELLHCRRGTIHSCFALAVSTLSSPVSRLPRMFAVVPVVITGLLCLLLPGGSYSCSPQMPAAAASFPGMLALSGPSATETPAPPIWVEARRAEGFSLGPRPKAQRREGLSGSTDSHKRPGQARSLGNGHLEHGVSFTT